MRRRREERARRHVVAGGRLRARRTGARGRQSEIRIHRSGFGLLTGNVGARRAAMHENVASVLLRDVENRRERARAREADERVERQHGADQSELGMRALQFLGRPCEVRGRQRRERREPCRMPADER